MRALIACGAVLFSAATLASQTVWTANFAWHATAEASVGHASRNSRWAIAGDQGIVDLSASLRAMGSAEKADLRLNAEVEFESAWGDTVEQSAFAPVGGLTAATELLDLSSSWSEGTRHRIGARVDRFAAAWNQPWGTLTAGRQAITWGGGMVFNPFDLFNPFAPADVVRDYKAGADMIHADVTLPDGGLQLLAVGRRDGLTGKPAGSASSLATLWQHHAGNSDFSLLAAWHHDEPVLGVGVGGYLGAATWRIDTTWMRVRPDSFSEMRAHFSAVANLQYSWAWGGRNFYGFLEYHRSGAGRSDGNYAAALQDPFLLTQLARRQAFVLGRHYGAASLQVELHPLVHLWISVIANLRDPSALVQPRLNWNASQTLQISLGIDAPLGAHGSEFGGFDPGDGLGTTRAPLSGYVRATWDF